MVPETQLNDFVKNYRDALARQYQSSVQSLNQQRLNDQRSIMSNANARGMMYSNFPTRDKIIYDQQTFLPNYTKLYQSYSTGLDKLRQNVVNYQNSIKSIQDAIADLNAT